MLVYFSCVVACSSRTVKYHVSICLCAGLPGRERRTSGTKVRTLKPGQDVEELVANALVSTITLSHKRLLSVYFSN